MNDVIRNSKPRKIAVLNGILHGHFTGSVEVVRELAGLGHDVTCFVTDEFVGRLNGIPVKKVVYSADASEIAKRLPPEAPVFAVNSFMVGKATDAVISLLLNDKTDYDIDLGGIYLSPFHHSPMRFYRAYKGEEDLPLQVDIDSPVLHQHVLIG